MNIRIRNDVGLNAINEREDVMTIQRLLAQCSGQQKLATVLEFFQNNRSDSLGVKPPLYWWGLSWL